MPADAAKADAEALRDLFVGYTAHKKLHHFSAARREPDGLRSGGHAGVRHKQKLTGAVHVVCFPEFREIPAQRSIGDIKGCRYIF